jgi:hypothetical protein
VSIPQRDSIAASLLILILDHTLAVHFSFRTESESPRWTKTATRVILFFFCRVPYCEPERPVGRSDRRQVIAEGPHHMSDSKSGVNKFLDTTAEPALKLGAAGLGALYVFGLLVSNVHLMAVGVSEFTSLRAQNVMTGSLTAFYFVSLLVLALPWCVAACTCGIALCSNQALNKAGACAQVLTLAVVLWLFTAWMIGLAWGFLYPWGRPWVVTQNVWSLKASFRDFGVIAQQFIDTFGTRKAVVAFLAFSVVLAYWLIKLDVTRFFGASRNSLGPNAADWARVGLMLGRLVMPLFVLIAIVCTVFGFADDVYPNIRANLGGGQPDVVELQLEPGESGKITLPFDLASAPPAQPGAPTRIGPVVVWYQSDKFLYLSPFVENDPASERLLAIDIKMVRVIRYIPASVRISGRHIVKIYKE